jgi:hypothetical protein
VIEMATCPLCSEAFDGGEPYLDHLEEAHGLRDDEGTATVTQIRAHRIEDDAAMTLVAEAVLDSPPTNGEGSASAPAVSAAPAPAVSAAGSAAATGAIPAPTPVAARTRPSPASPSDRYLLASRHGDVALYGPGLVMLLTGVARLEADLLGLLLIVLGTALVVLGMLLPLVLGRR